IQLETEDYTSNLPYSAPAVKFLLENAGYKGDYTTKSKGTYLWFDTDSHIIILRKLEEMIEEEEETTKLSFTPFNIPKVSAEGEKYKLNYNFWGPEDLFLTKNDKPVILLGGNKGDNLVSAVRTIRNLGANPDNANNLQQKLNKIANTDLRIQLKHLVNHSLFVGSSNYYKEDEAITNIIFSEEKNLRLTKDIFPEALDYSNVNSVIVAPNVVKVESDTFDNLIGDLPLMLILENKNTDVSSIDIREKNIEFIFENDGTNYKANNPLMVNFREVVLSETNLEAINNRLTGFAKLNISDVPNKDCSYDVTIEIDDPGATPIPLNVVLGVIEALQILAANDVKAADVYPLQTAFDTSDYSSKLLEMFNLTYRVEDFVENFIFVGIIVFLGLFYDEEQNDFVDSNGKTLISDVEIKNPLVDLIPIIKDIALGDLVGRNTVQVVGIVEEEDDKMYKVIYNFTFVDNEENIKK
ncbi:MAG TPA: hypothetical protein GX692_07185, partial [Acholeplasmataceae bacterium]|nr:hypothetical protein [Acholeplasmataceae bacterium]